jgi:hypothetical protein
MEMPLSRVCGLLYVGEYAPSILQPTGLDAPVFVFVDAFGADVQELLRCVQQTAKVVV